MSDRPGKTTTGPRASVLIVDNDPAIVKSLSAHITREGFEPIPAHSGQEGVHAFLERLPQAVILRDVMPGLSGWEVAQQIREMSDVPILFLSDHKDRASMERALRMGDDYMAPPWSWERLSAKLTALLKRSSAKASHVLIYDDGFLRIDFAHRHVTRQGEPVHLTETEFRLLSYFVRRMHQVLRYEELLANVWDHTYLKAKSHVSVYVGYLRKKIEADPSHPAYIHTERGLGYSFRPRPNALLKTQPAD